MVMLVMLVSCKRCNATQRYKAGIIIITGIYLRRELQSQPHLVPREECFLQCLL